MLCDSKPAIAEWPGQVVLVHARPEDIATAGVEGAVD
jgi:hypothetical protein